MARLAAVAALFLALAACSDDGGDEAATTTTTTTMAPAPTTMTSTRPTTTIGGCGPTEPPVATFDLDGDGAEEVWRPAGSGASVLIVELRRVVGCEEEAVLLRGGAAQFAYGGSVQRLFGLRCEPGSLVELQASSEDAEIYTTEVVTYELVGNELVERSREAGDPLLPSDHDAYVAYQSFDC